MLTISKIDKEIDYSRIYSASKLDLFSQCPQEYYFSYIDPIYSKMKNRLKKLPENIWSFNTLGKAVHNAITLFYHLKEEQRTRDNLLLGLKETWKSEVIKNKTHPLGKWGGFSSLEEERSCYQEAIDMLKKFLKIADMGLKIAYLPTSDFQNSIEDFHDSITPLTEDFDIGGKFDLIAEKDTFLQLIDFKTGKSEDDNFFQLRFYKLLVELKFEKAVKEASYYFLRTGNIKTLDFKKEDNNEIKKEVIAKVKKIKSTKKFEAQPSKLCKFCLFKTFCPKRQEVAEIIKDVRKKDYSDDLPF